jgi:16S rRNA (cytosine1402-N4)-methyltransferase
MSHIPVLLKESIEAMNLKAGDFVADCTTNRAGHSIEIAKKIGPKGILICIDLDGEALKEAEIFLSSFAKASEDTEKIDLPKMYFVKDNFRNLKNILEDLKIKSLDSLIADLGVSSQEIDESGRGYTFQKDEPLLMTLSDNSKNILTARDIVNN